VDLFRRRTWHVPRPVPEPAALARAVDVIRNARRPLLVAGGGVVYSEAAQALRALVDATGIPVAETQAGKGSLPHAHPSLVGALGATGTTAANELARQADVVIGVGTRYTDFTTASRTAFQEEGVRFVNVNVAAFDAAKHAGTAVVADARVALDQLRESLRDWSVPGEHRARAAVLAARWDETVDLAVSARHAPLPSQAEVIGTVNAAVDSRDVVVAAAGSLPGDLHKLWRASDPKGYHVEYGFSCMGYEIAGGIGVKLAAPDRHVVVMVGDGSYLMMAQELVTAVQERVPLTVVLVQNHGFASIGALSETVGANRFGTWYRYRDENSGRLDGSVLPVDLAANAESLGVQVHRVAGVEELRKALLAARDAQGPVLIHVETDPLLPAPSSESWWEVPVAEVSTLPTTQRARDGYVARTAQQQTYL
jgi:3D-(3,5/4)-trihydroxycyclohexane-1,2-dione acylhydrolase (decyclizing)